MPPSSNATSWFSHFFDNHPQHGGQRKNPEAYDGNGKYRKVYCKNCFKVQLDSIVQEELQQHAEGTLSVLRTNVEIQEFCVIIYCIDFTICTDPITSAVWSKAAKSVQSGDNGRQDGWLKGRPESMLGHLQRCPYQTSNVINRAKEDYVQHKAGRSSRQPATDQAVGADSMPSASVSNYISQLPPLISQQSSEDANIQPSSPSNSAIIFNERNVAPGPTDSVSVVSSRVQSLSRHGSRTSGHGGTLRPSSIWGNEEQSSFEIHLIRLIAEGNLPLRFSENRRWLLFCQMFMPHAKIPSRKVLTNRILPRELQHWRTQAYNRLSGQLVTLQSDGWTGINNRHYIAFIVTTPSQVCKLLLFLPHYLKCFQVLPVRVFDVSADRKTAENLLALMEEVTRILHNTHIIVVAWTTDASGESRKARNLLAAKKSYIAVPDCYAH